MFLPSNSVIETKRLQIRLVQQGDLPALIQVNGNDEVTRYLPYRSWKDIPDGKAWYDRTITRLEAGSAGQFVIVCQESGHVIGTCLLFGFDKESARAELGYVLAPQYWGKGFMFEAMSAFLAFGFGPVELRRIEAEVDPRNTKSCKLLERLGFVKEGYFRQRSIMKGEIVDSNFYGLLRADWFANSGSRD